MLHLSGVYGRCREAGSCRKPVSLSGGSAVLSSAPSSSLLGTPNESFALKNLSGFHHLAVSEASQDDSGQLHSEGLTVPLSDPEPSVRLGDVPVHVKVPRDFGEGELRSFQFFAEDDLAAQAGVLLEQRGHVQHVILPRRRGQ